MNIVITWDQRCSRDRSFRTHCESCGKISVDGYNQTHEMFPSKIMLDAFYWTILLKNIFAFFVCQIQYSIREFHFEINSIRKRSLFQITPIDAGLNKIVCVLY